MSSTRPLLRKKCTRRRWGRAETRSTRGRSVKACGSASTVVSSAASDRCIDSRTRCSSHRVGDREETHMDGHRTSFHRHCSTLSHRSSGVREGWLSDRNCDLTNAIEFGNPGLVGQIGHLIGQGARQLEISRDQSNVPMNGQGKSSMMATLIDQADAKRRCIETTQLDGSQM